MTLKIAVIGSGVSGLAATWLLNEFSDHEVHLYEADERVGGHANTVRFKPPGGNDSQAVDVDTGFIVFNPSTYPNFLRFLRMYPNLKGAILPTDMTFSVSRDGGAYEWAGKSLSTFFTDIQRVFDRKTWRLLYDILRFNACARRLAMKGQQGQSDDDNISVGEYLHQEGYSDMFKDNYLLPMTAAIWSTPSDKCALDFPAQTLVQFLYNHHLLQIFGKPSWLTLRGGSQIYVKHIVSSLPASQLHLNTRVTSMFQHGSGSDSYHIELHAGSSVVGHFNHVILACHSDDAAKILRSSGQITRSEERLLSSFSWNLNEAVLHSDTKGNFIVADAEKSPHMGLLELPHAFVKGQVIRREGHERQPGFLVNWMNDLQHIPAAQHGQIFVTLNPPFEPDAKKVVGRYTYSHPVIDAQAIRAQRAMKFIQNTRGISYAGAWLKYGFHEDGFTSGLEAALAVGGIICPPFDIHDADREPGPVFVARLFDILEYAGASLRSVIGCVLGCVLYILHAVFGDDD